MTAEAWVALGLGLAGIAFTMFTAVWAISGQLSKALTRFELVAAQQATEINQLKQSIDKLEEIVASVALQRDQIQSIRDTITQNTARTDNTFSRVFQALDRINERWQGKRLDSSP